METNDLVLRRIGSELHDGPAQLISLALLRLDALRPKSKGDTGEVPMDDFERIRGALVDSLAEIRNMSAGLTLPELDRVTPAEALALAARTHERRTGTTVKSELTGLPPHLSNALKACLYRFAQEALNNAFRHGGGKGQTLRGTCVDDVLQVEVADAGPGFEPGQRQAHRREPARAHRHARSGGVAGRDLGHSIAAGTRNAVDGTLQIVGRWTSVSRVGGHR